jgi:hypothetical protein
MATDPGLREELLRMAAADQDARARLDDHPRPADGRSEQEPTPADRVRAVDAANTARMRAVVHAHGWPGRSLSRLPDRPGPAGRGRPQLYGTQVIRAGGTWRPRPLADPDQVDDRRRQVGLEPLDDYLRMLPPPGPEDPTQGDEDEAARPRRPPPGGRRGGSQAAWRWRGGDHSSSCA